MKRELLHQAFDPEAFRLLGKEVIDLLADYLQESQAGDGRKVMPFVDPDEALKFWQEDLDKAKSQTPFSFFEKSLDNSLLLHHPHYMGHQMSVPAPISVLAGMLASLLNNGMAIYETGPVSSPLDRLLVDEVNKVIGYGPDSSGIMTSGGTLSNLTALLAARSIKAKEDVWKSGTRKQYALLVSEEAHYCVDRAVRIMGWGEEGIIKVPTDENYRIRIDLLEDLMQEAHTKGIEVLAVVGSACTTSTGTYDDLEGIARFCEKHDLWFHVDGAHGVAAAFSPHYKELVKGLHRADSITMDFHKMLLTPATTTALLFKRGGDSFRTFSQKAQYLWEEQEEAEWFNMAKRTVECTKRMMSLQAYLLIRTYGMGLFEEYVDLCYQNGEQFAQMVDEHPNFELATQPDGNIVCFRYRFDTRPVDEWNAFNKRLRRLLLEEGHYYIVQTLIRGQLFLRVTLMNPFTRKEHMKGLLDHILGKVSVVGKGSLNLS
ncbi:MAG: aminotransferase class V-fold PLP-dependent enzyme [Bacteroidota bacterium]